MDQQLTCTCIHIFLIWASSGSLMLILEDFQAQDITIKHINILVCARACLHVYVHAHVVKV